MRLKKLTSVALNIFSFSLLGLTISANSSAKDLPNLNWVLQTTETSLAGPYVSPWVKFSKAVKARTNGKFDIHVALAKELGIDRGEFPQAVSSGQIQIAFLMSSVAQGTLPYLGVFNLPYLTRDQKSVLKVEKAIHKKIEKDFEKLGYKVLTPNAFFVWPPQDLLSRAPIDNLAELSGLKVRIWRDPDRKLVSNLGGNPVYMPVDEVYAAMQRHVVDALNTGPQAMVNSSMWEVGKYYYSVSLEPGGNWIIINKNAWENLPKKYKTILKQECNKTINRIHDKWNSLVKAKRAILVKHGVKVNHLTGSEKEAWVKAAKPIWENWAQEDKSNQKVLDVARKVLHLNQ